MIPLLDCVYDHVIKRYPKRAFCILRNCVRVSDLLRSTQVSQANTEEPRSPIYCQETVFELVRPPRAPSCPACSSEPRGHLRPKSQGARIALRSAPSCSCAQSCCTSLSTGSTSTGSTGPGSLAARAGNHPNCGGDHEASSNGSGINGTGLSHVDKTEGKSNGDQWVVGVPDKKEPGKSRKLMSFLEHNNEVTHINNCEIKHVFR